MNVPGGDRQQGPARKQQGSKGARPHLNMLKARSDPSSILEWVLNTDLTWKVKRWRWRKRKEGREGSPRLAGSIGKLERKLVPPCGQATNRSE
eukprot:6362278-Amphidinium_carterae.1